MNSYGTEGNNLYSLAPGSKTADSPNMQDMTKIQHDTIDGMVWAAAQQNALAKMELFTKMAKKINDQP